MKTTKVARLYLALFFFCGVPLAQQPKLTWYAFHLDFVSSHYSDSAICELRAKAARTAKNVHTMSCGVTTPSYTSAFCSTRWVWPPSKCRSPALSSRETLEMGRSY